MNATEQQSDLPKESVRSPGATKVHRLGIGKVVPLLMFADDLLVMSTSPVGLQQQPDALHGFCDSRELTGNAANIGFAEHCLSLKTLKDVTSCTVEMCCKGFAGSSIWDSPLIMMHSLVCHQHLKRGAKLQTQHCMH